jgi:hypothetical protein
MPFYQLMVRLEADDNEDAIAKLESIAFPAGTTVLGMTPVPEPVLFAPMPQVIEDEGGSVEGLEEVPMEPMENSR